MFLETTSLPKGIKYLLFANVGFYIILRITGLYALGIDALSLVPERVFYGFQIWRLFTYLFIHISFFWHLLFNVFSLWMFGPSIERHMGMPRFLFYYFLTGICGALFAVFLSPSSYMPVVGCSASILGLLVAFAVFFPDAVITLLFPPVSMKAKHFALIIGALQFLMIFESQSGINWPVHLGGMAIGYIYLRYFMNMGIIVNFSRLQEKFIQRKKEEREEFIKEKLDPILDKISKYGIESLSWSEKQILKKAHYKVKK
jgi:membrane associated rhomboid family serine protease